MRGIRIINKYIINISETVMFNDETGVMEVVIRTAQAYTPQNVAKATFTYEVDTAVPGSYQELVRYEEHGVTMGWQKNPSDQASVHITITAPVSVVIPVSTHLDGGSTITVKMFLSKEQIAFLRSFSGIGTDYFFSIFPIRVALA